MQGRCQKRKKEAHIHEHLIFSEYCFNYTWKKIFAHKIVNIWYSWKLYLNRTETRFLMLPILLWRNPSFEKGGYSSDDVKKYTFIVNKYERKLKNKQISYNSQNWTKINLFQTRIIVCYALLLVIHKCENSLGYFIPLPFPYACSKVQIRPYLWDLIMSVFLEPHLYFSI